MAQQSPPSLCSRSLMSEVAIIAVIPAIALKERIYVHPRLPSEAFAAAFFIYKNLNYPQTQAPLLLLPPCNHLAAWCVPPFPQSRHLFWRLLLVFPRTSLCCFSFSTPSLCRRSRSLSATAQVTAAARRRLSWLPLFSLKPVCEARNVSLEPALLLVLQPWGRLLAGVFSKLSAP